MSSEHERAVEGAIASLSEKQRACLRLVWEGFETKEIAPRVGLAPTTVDRYIERATKSLGCGRRSQAARLLAAHEGRSERLVPEPFGRDAAPEQRHPVDADSVRHTVREERAEFDGFEPRLDRRSREDDASLSPLRSLGWICIILFALVAALVLLKPGAESLQDIANLIDPPRRIATPG